MRDLIADRFLPSTDGQMDLASGAPVHLRLLPAGTWAQQAVWSDRCGTLARLRHPLLNALLDYGAAGPRQLFEAYEIGAPPRAVGATAAGMIRHVVRFLESHAVPLPPGAATPAVRQLTIGAGSRGRAVGVVLQARRILDTVTEVLRETTAGVGWIEVHGGAGSGVRTLWMLVARAARLEGYVPIAARVLASRPWLADALVSRHVVVLVDSRLDRASRRALSAIVARLGGASSRHHVVISFSRGERVDGRALEVERMGDTAMCAMVYRDRVDGPSVEDLTEGVRKADGRPGALVELLSAVKLGRRGARLSVVRESSAEYIVAPDPPLSPPARRRIGAALHGALARADLLAARGRHGSAVRLLDRASRVLDGRAEPRHAARCALALGWIHRDRGRTADALHQFERARTLAAGSEVSVQAAIGTGVVWTDEDRLVEADALLRSAQSAASLLDDEQAGDAAAVALARCVMWRGHIEEAAAIIRPILTRRAGLSAWALSARIHLAAHATRCAGQAATQAVESAAVVGTPRAAAIAARATVLVRAAAGDVHGAREAAVQGLAAAAKAHLPLHAVRLRAAWLTAYRHAGTSQEASGLRRHLTAARARPLPALLHRQIDDAVRTHAGQGSGAPAADCALADLRHLLETTQAKQDDQTALQALVDALAARLRAVTAAVVAAADGRVIARAGRLSGADPAIALQAIAANAPVRSHAAPFECAVPVTYAGETIGALGCRWSAGAVVDLDQAAAVCAAAALAAAASLRGLADRGPEPQPDATWDDLLGTSPSASELRRSILNAARAPFPVLVSGESGSGKELVARAIHRLGPRRHRRLCTINCAAISDELLEAELFGHTRGAFTGAVSERPGLFEEADGGTLFLDEVGELSGRAQAKLLRVLQDGEVRRVGENLPRRVDTRVISATNRCLEREVQAGRFRADLRFRLDVIRIAVPPLRERATDIPVLVAHFWQDAAARVGSRATLAPETVAALTRYEWPGNVRELQNAVAALAVHGPRRGRITPGTLPDQLARAASTAAPVCFEAAREEFERRYVRAALARAGGRRAGAARALGVSRQGLAKMLRRLRIDEPEAPANP